MPGHHRAMHRTRTLSDPHHPAHTTPRRPQPGSTSSTPICRRPQTGAQPPRALITDPPHPNTHHSAHRFTRPAISRTTRGWGLLEHAGVGTRTGPTTAYSTARLTAGAAPGMGDPA